MIFEIAANSFLIFLILLQRYIFNLYFNDNKYGTDFQALKITKNNCMVFLVNFSNIFTYLYFVLRMLK